MHSIMSSVPRNGRGKRRRRRKENRGRGKKGEGEIEGLKPFINQFAANWQHPPTMTAADRGQAHTIARTLCTPGVITNPSIKMISVSASRTRGCVSRSHSCFLLRPSWLQTTLQELQLERDGVPLPLLQPLTLFRKWRNKIPSVCRLLGWAGDKKAG